MSCPAETCEKGLTPEEIAEQERAAEGAAEGVPVAPGTALGDNEPPAAQPTEDAAA